MTDAVLFNYVFDMKKGKRHYNPNCLASDNIYSSLNGGNYCNSKHPRKISRPLTDIDPDSLFHYDSCDALENDYRRVKNLANSVKVHRSKLQESKRELAEKKAAAGDSIRQIKPKSHSNASKSLRLFIHEARARRQQHDIENIDIKIYGKKHEAEESNVRLLQQEMVDKRSIVLPEKKAEESMPQQEVKMADVKHVENTSFQVYGKKSLDNNISLSLSIHRVLLEEKHSDDPYYYFSITLDKKNKQRSGMQQAIIHKDYTFFDTDHTVAYDISGNSGHRICVKLKHQDKHHPLNETAAKVDIMLDSLLNDLYQQGNEIDLKRKDFPLFRGGVNIGLMTISLSLQLSNFDAANKVGINDSFITESELDVSRMPHRLQPSRSYQLHLETTGDSTGMSSCGEDLDVLNESVGTERFVAFDGNQTVDSAFPPPSITPEFYADDSYLHSEHLVQQQAAASQDKVTMTMLLKRSTSDTRTCGKLFYQSPLNDTWLRQYFVLLHRDGFLYRFNQPSDPFIVHSFNLNDRQRYRLEIPDLTPLEAFRIDEDVDAEYSYKFNIVEVSRGIEIQHRFICTSFEASDWIKQFHRLQL